MGKEILVNVANRETRIAVFDDNQLVELRIEREEQVVGNIYKGRVENVLPGMDAAFVDIGLERNAFLYVADILPEYVDSDEDDDEENTEDSVDVVAENRSVDVAPRSDEQSDGGEAASTMPAASDGGNSRSGQRNRNRRGRARRDEAPTESAAPVTVSSESGGEDYSLYLSDPDRGQTDLENESEHSFLAGMSTEDGVDFGDIAEVEYSEDDENSAASPTDNAESEIIGSSEYVPGGSPAAQELAEDGEIDPHAADLARENEEIYDEGTVGDSDNDNAAAGPTDSAAPAEEPAAGSESVYSNEAPESEAELETPYVLLNDELDQNAAMIDALSLGAADEPSAEQAQQSNTDAEEAPAESRAEVVRAPASRPGGRRGAGNSERGDKPIGQAKRPAQRRSGAPGGGRPGGRGFSRRHASIADLVQTKQELLLQVVKGPRGTKGSRVSTRMSLPGRYLVLMPDANNLGVSRKIEESKERDRLKTVVERFRQPGYGIIVRTEAEGRSANDLYQDYSMLVETWQNVWAKAKITPAPSLIQKDQSLIYTIMRDVFGSDIDRLIIDSAEDYARACEIIDRISPDLTDRIHLYDGEKPLFDAFRVEQDIERLLRRKVWLKSGGYLVIDQTEALTSIDVNTGKFVGSSGSGLSETILQTNMEATGEIARQLRLRDLGGMIVLDFIDMDNQRDKKLVMDTLFKALKYDRSRTKIASISPLGLIEMTRKRTKETVDVALTDTCPYCQGIGRVPSAETVSMQAEREIAKIAAEVNSDAIVVTAHPDVIAHLVGEQGQDIDALERQVRRAIYARADSDYHIEKYEVEPGSVSKIEQSYPLPRRGQVIEGSVQKSALSALPWATAYTGDGYQVELGNGARAVGQNAKIRLLSVARSYAVGEVLGGSGGNGSGGGNNNNGGNGSGKPPQGRQNPQQSGGARPEQPQQRGGRRGA